MIDIPDISERIRQEKAKGLLQDVMGKNTYDKFIKNRKLEIKSGKYTYILDYQGNIVNKNNRFVYCITASGTTEIPFDDIIAIRYSWLKYGSDIVEKVANRRPLHFQDPINNVFEERRRNKLNLVAGLFSITIAIIYIIFDQNILMVIFYCILAAINFYACEFPKSKVLKY